MNVKAPHQLNPVNVAAMYTLVCKKFDALKEKTEGSLHDIKIVILSMILCFEKLSDIFK